MNVQPMPVPLNFSILPMSPADIEQVSAAEKKLHPSPWTRGNFADALAAGYNAQVMRHTDGRLVAYGLVMQGVEEAELLNLSVIKEFQRQGVGTLLCEHLLQRAKIMGALRMFLEVRAGNIAGRALYQRLGFAEIGQRRGYYADADNRREDAIIMEKALSG